MSPTSQKSSPTPISGRGMAKPIHGLLDRLIEQFAAAIALRAEQMFARSAAGRGSRLGAVPLRLCPAPGCKNPGGGPRAGPGTKFMPFIHEVEVVEADIDNLGHASNLVYLRWVQEAALAHSTALGFPETAYLARGQAWVVRTHEIEYLRAAVLADRLRIETRVATMKVANSLRKTGILLADQLICRAATDWVYFDLARGRPLRIPDDLRSAFPIEP